MISIELHGQLLPARPRKQQLEMNDVSCVADAVAVLGLDEDVIGLMTINGVQSELQDRLPPDSRLSLFPYLSGG